VPATFADRAGQIAAEAGMDIAVLDEEALAGGGYGGILGVGQGSVHPPRLVRLEYAPPQASKVLVLAGKGITFDSGGLSLKPAKAMETMKSDMGGAAAVLGAMQAIAALGLSVRVIGYLPLAENMPSGTAQRPSDVLTIYGGTTVEVLNTDAEGRLVLADALARSGSDSPDVLVDVATLTGAQVVSLGPRVAGVMANDDALRTRSWTRPGGPARRCGRCPSRRAPQGPGVVRRRPHQRGPGPQRGDAGGRAVPARVRAPGGALGASGHRRAVVQRRAATWVYPKGGTGAATRALVQIAQDMADGRCRPGQAGR
jgi:leucyl aminopeptidase